MSPAIAAALTTTVLVHIVLSASLFSATRVYRRAIPGTFFWFAAAVCAAGGHALFLLPERLFSPPVFVAANSLLAAGVVAAAAGAWTLSGRPRRTGLIASAIAAAVAIYCGLAAVDRSFALRSVVLGAFTAAGSGTAAFALFFPRRKEDRAVTVFGAGVFSILAAISALRIAAFIAKGTAEATLAPPQWYGMVVYASLVAYVALGVAFFLMVGGLLTRSLDRSLAENKTLLSEIKHRTKNNFALISSLVSLQRDGLQDPAAKQALGELNERIRTVTTVHRLLSRVEDGHEADAKQYLESLCAGIRDSIASARKRIAFSVRADSRLMDARDLVNLGLIVNELATNALKHAFPEAEAGEMRLVFSAEGKKSSLVFSDDGRGFDPSESGGGLGLTLVRSLVAQLRGRLTIRSAPGEGAEVALEFES